MTTFKGIFGSDFDVKQETVMENNKTIHRASTRGHANHGWLDTHHTFSFSGYHNPERIHFGVLRVLNDDIVAPGMGFGTHPHDNMEIVSIPLVGTLEHKDSMGNIAVIREGEIQIMSAGTGITHSEYNKSEQKLVKFLQIWIYPNKRSVKPRYGQMELDREKMRNNLLELISPDRERKDTLWLHQDCWFSMGDLDKGTEIDYEVKRTGNGIYLFVIEGEIEVDGEKLTKRDGMGITEVERVKIKSGAQTRLLIMDIPMVIR